MRADRAVGFCIRENLGPCRKRTSWKPKNGHAAKDVYFPFLRDQDIFIWNHSFSWKWITKSWQDAVSFIVNMICVIHAKKEKNWPKISNREWTLRFWISTAFWPLTLQRANRQIKIPEPGRIWSANAKAWRNWNCLKIQRYQLWCKNGVEMAHNNNSFICIQHNEGSISMLCS